MVIGSSILIAIVGAIVITLIYAAIADEWVLRKLVAFGVALCLVLIIALSGPIQLGG
jgi:fucose permease